MAKKKDNTILYLALFAGAGVAIYYATRKPKTTDTTTTQQPTGTLTLSSEVPDYGAFTPITYNKYNAWVKALQQLLGFTGKDVDGIVGPKTLTALVAAGVDWVGKTPGTFGINSEGLYYEVNDFLQTSRAY